MDKRYERVAIPLVYSGKSDYIDFKLTVLFYLLLYLLDLLQDEAAGLFSYYTSKEKMRRGVRRG